MAPELVKTTEDGLATDTALDRRRPGRSGQVNPELIPLLRGIGDQPFAVPEQLADSNSLAPSRGIVRAVLISAVAWPLILLAAWIGWSRIF
jgi:hypothetical protein